MSPPKWPIKLLSYFLQEEYLEEIEGDMEEVYHDDLNHYRVKQANWRYYKETIKLLRPALLKNLQGEYKLNNYGMFRNNLKIGIRVLRRDKVFSMINIIGLSTGLAISLLIMLYVQFELSYEKYNPNADHLVRITIDLFNGETIIDQDCETYPPLGDRILSEFSEVVDFTHAYDIDEMTVKAGDQFFSETKVYAVDPSFFQLFQYPLIHGDARTVFQAANEVVLTETQAIKYFNNTDVVGKSIWLASVDKHFKITGIVPDSPPNTHLKFDMLISYLSMKASFGEKENNWNGNNTYTYVKLVEPTQLEYFKDNLARLNDLLQSEDKLENERMVAQPIADIHLYSHKSFEPENNGDATSVYFLLGVGILVFLLAIVNYINLSTSKSLDRAKEVGIRKIVGSSLFQLRMQFFIESFLINLFAALLAVMLMILSLNYFVEIANLPYTFTFLSNTLFWLVLAVVVLLSTVLSGIFPALILSSFEPIAIIKGRFTSSARGTLLRKLLVISQFAITLFLLIQTLTVRTQLTYMKNKDQGLNIEQVVVVRAPHTEALSLNYSTFKKELLGQTQFQAVTLSSAVPGLATGELGTTSGINLVEAIEESSFNFYLYQIDAEFIPTMEMSLVAGENFIPNSKNKLQILVNEKTIKLWGIPTAAEAIGKKVMLFGEHRNIKGVMKDFHQTGAKSDYIPMIFFHSDNFNNLVSIRIQPDNIRDQVDMIEQIFESSFPSSPFDYFFIDQAYDKQYQSEDRFQQVFTILTGFAILIACLGLFGLTSFMVSKRVKEIGVRKVLGANIAQIVFLLSKEFTWMISVAMLIALPLTFFLIDAWLVQYAFRIDIQLWLFAFPAITVFVVSFLTVFAKTFHIAKANPVDALRNE